MRERPPAGAGMGYVGGVTVGEVVAGRFELLAEAGKGGMGSVYRAHDRRTGELVAVKVLSDWGTDALPRFLREAEILAGIDHPAVVRYVAHGESGNGKAYLAMEWLEGEDLEQRLAREPLSIGEAVALAALVADALAAAHGRGIVHRDVKPSNLWLVRRRLDAVKVLDFGIARVKSAPQALTRTGVFMGTAAYMAPEQVRSARDVGTAIDVFALGCVLYECLTGRGAFAAPDLLGVLAKIVFEEPVPLGEIVAVPPDLARLVERMLAKDPAARPSGMADLAGQLRALASTTQAAREPSVAPPPAAALGDAEQRLASIVLATPGAPATATGGDLGLADTQVGLGAAEDPLLAEGAARFGVTLERLVDGSIAALFTDVGAATDLAARAARCALWLREALPAAAIAVATGRAVLAARAPVGAIIDRAARVLAADSRGGVVHLDEVTAGLLDASFDVEGDVGRRALAGVREVGPGARTLLGRPTTCVGRERELAALAGLFAEAEAESVARAALVVAPGGVGKSRLRHELVARLERTHDALPATGERAGGAEGRPPITVLSGRGDPMSAGSPFGLIAPMVRRSMGIVDGEPPMVQRNKMRARVARVVPEADRERVVEFLGELVSVPTPAEEESVQLRAARSEALLMGDQMRRAWADWLAAECRAAPVLVVLEDLHWGDLPSAQFVDAALRDLCDSPLMVLALARPEVHAAFPKLWSGRAFTEIRLDGLSRKAAEKLAREVLGDRVGDAEIARVVERAEGNAFYLEELIRAVAEGARELPETVLAMAHARLEGLPFAARRLLRAASVFGMVFERAGVARLLGDAEVADADLATLEGDELVERRGGRADGEHVFRHALLREAAYGMLTDEDRALGHRLAAEWLESTGRAQPAILAEHFERGGEPARAVTFYRRAAEQAFEGNDFGATEALSDRAIACGAAGEVRGALDLLRAEAFRWQGRYAEAQAAGVAAMEALPRGGSAWHAAAGEVAVACSLRDDRARLEQVAADLADLGARAADADDAALAARVIAWARAATWLLLFGMDERGRQLFALIDAAEPRIAGREPSAHGRIHYAHATRALCAAEPEEYFLRSEGAAARFDEAGNARSACVQRHNGGNALRQLGLYDEAERVLRESLGAAEQRGLWSPVAEARHWLGLVRAAQGNRAEAESLAAGALDAARRAGSRRVESKALAQLAELALTAGDLERALPLARAATEVGKTIPVVMAYACAVLARVELALGMVDDAVRDSGLALAPIAAGVPLEGAEVAIRLARAEALEAAGDLAGARAEVERARDRVEAASARIRRPEARRAYRERVIENARALALASAPASDPALP